MYQPSRRAMLGAVAGLGSLLAGCSARVDADGDADDLSFDRLQRTAVYVHPEVDLTLASEVATVEATNNADLLVLPGDTAHGPSQAVDWLAADRILALLGAGAEGRWLDWARSDAFANTFDERGVSDAEPDPTLVVAAATGLQVHTYRHSWSDPPRDRDVLRALDEDLVDIEAESPT